MEQQLSRPIRPVSEAPVREAPVREAMACCGGFAALVALGVAAWFGVVMVCMRF